MPRHAVLLVLTLLVPAPASAAKVTLWHAWRGDEQVALTEALAALQARRPDIVVEPLALPNEAFRQRLTNAIPHGNGPDLFIAAHESIGEWARGGLIVPATFPPELGPSAFVESTQRAVQWSDQSWAIPLASKSIALYHRAGAIPPPDLESWPSHPDRPAIAWEVGNFYYHAAILHAHGGHVFGTDGRPTLDSPEFIESLHTLIELQRRGLIPAEADGAMVTNLWRGGLADAVLAGPWFMGEIEAGFEVTVLPALRPGGAPLRPLLTVESLFRAARSDAADADVAEIITALAGFEGARLRAIRGRQVPSLRVAWQDPALASDTILGAFASQAALAEPMPNVPEMAAVWEPANRALRSVLRGDLSPEAAAARAQEELLRSLRPPPEASAPGPWLVALALFLLGGALVLVKRARARRVVPRLVATWASWIYVLPAVAGIALLVVLPFMVGAAVSLFAHQDGTYTFVGLRNFTRILFSSEEGVWEPMSFWFTLVVTVLWTAVNVLLHTGIGMGLALLLREPWVRLRGLWRVLLIVPWAVPNYITALIWKGMFNRQFGAINAVLVACGFEPVSWFSRFATSFAANVATNTWLGFPFMMVVTLGALQGIPRDLEEAAAVDGASAWQRFRHVTLPLLRPSLLPAVILGSVWTFNMFNVIYLVSGGEPGGSTEILITEAYRWAFTRQAQYGMASAYALLIFGILLVWGRLSSRLTEAPS